MMMRSDDLMLQWSQRDQLASHLNQLSKALLFKTITSTTRSTISEQNNETIKMLSTLESIDGASIEQRTASADPCFKLDHNLRIEIIDLLIRNMNHLTTNKPLQTKKNLLNANNAVMSSLYNLPLIDGNETVTITRDNKTDRIDVKREENSLDTSKVNGYTRVGLTMPFEKPTGVSPITGLDYDRLTPFDIDNINQLSAMLNESIENFQQEHSANGPLDATIASHQPILNSTTTETKESNEQNPNQLDDLFSNYFASTTDFNPLGDLDTRLLKQMIDGEIDLLLDPSLDKNDATTSTPSQVKNDENSENSAREQHNDPIINQEDAMMKKLYTKMVNEIKAQIRTIDLTTPDSSPARDANQTDQAISDNLTTSEPDVDRMRGDITPNYHDETNLQFEETMMTNSQNDEEDGRSRLHNHVRSSDSISSDENLLEQIQKRQKKEERPNFEGCQLSANLIHFILSEMHDLSKLAALHSSTEQQSGSMKCDQADENEDLSVHTNLESKVQSNNTPIGVSVIPDQRSFQVDDHTLDVKFVLVLSEIENLFLQKSRTYHPFAIKVIGFSGFEFKTSHKIVISNDYQYLSLGLHSRSGVRRCATNFQFTLLANRPDANIVKDSVHIFSFNDKKTLRLISHNKLIEQRDTYIEDDSIHIEFYLKISPIFRVDERAC